MIFTSPLFKIAAKIEEKEGANHDNYLISDLL